MVERVRRSNPVPHTVTQLLALLASPDVVRARGAADGMGTTLVSHDVSDTADGPVVRIVTATDIALDWLPDAIRSRLGSEPRVERTETWALDPQTGEAHTPLEFSFEGAPVSGAGTSRLTPDGTGGRLESELTIRVDVPLLGGLVERAVAPRLAAALDAEATFYASLPPAGTVTS